MFMSMAVVAIVFGQIEVMLHAMLRVMDSSTRQAEFNVCRFTLYSVSYHIR